MQADDDVGKVAAASTHLVGTGRRRTAMNGTSAPLHVTSLTPSTHAPPLNDSRGHRGVPEGGDQWRRLRGRVAGIEAPDAGAHQGARWVLLLSSYFVYVSRLTFSRLTFSFVRSPVMMEPTLDFCRGVVQHAPDLTEEGADGAPSRPKKERKPREKKPAAKKETTKKKRKVKSESEEDDEDDEDEEDEWDTADETEEEDDDDDARGANGAKPAKTTKTAKTTTNEVKTEQKRDVEDIKVDLGDLGDLAVDGLVGEDDLQAVGGVDAAAAEEEDYDDF